MLQSTRSVTKQWLQARRNRKPACFWFAAATCFWPNRFVEHQEPARIVPVQEQITRLVFVGWRAITRWSGLGSMICPVLIRQCPRQKSQFQKSRLLKV